MVSASFRSIPFESKFSSVSSETMQPVTQILTIRTRSVRNKKFLYLNVAIIWVAFQHAGFSSDCHKGARLASELPHLLQKG